MEFWKEIPNTKGYYQISNLGNMRSIERTITYRDGKIRTYPSVIFTPRKTTGGYLIQGISILNKHQTIVIHSMVAQLFIRPKKLDEIVNHKNGIKTDNKVCNLEYVTRSENIKHSYRVLGRTDKQGSNHPRSLLNEDIVKYIREHYSDNTQVTLANKFGVSKCTISDVIRRKTWRHI